MTAWINSPQRRRLWYEHLGGRNRLLTWIWLFHIYALYRSEAKHWKEVGKSGEKQHLLLKTYSRQRGLCHGFGLTKGWLGTWDHTGLKSLKQNKWTQTQRQLDEPLLRSRFHSINTVISGLLWCLQVTVHILHHYKIWTGSVLYTSGRRTYNDSSATTGLTVSSWVSRVVRSGLVITENQNTKKRQ